MKFVNRIKELARLRKIPSGLIVIFGRRRVGKTALISEWGKIKPIFYTQAIEGPEAMQIEQLALDLKGCLPEGIVPRSWKELLATLKLIQKETVIVIDELPYLVKSTSSLPSLLQRWIDHDIPRNLTLILLGSSQTMMHGLFLSSTSPLYERANEVIHLKPMGYKAFCNALNLDNENPAYFDLFSLVGGVPRYWEFLDPKASVEANALELFFKDSARLEFEPERLLKDENIAGEQAKAILEAIGRGASRPSEIAARLHLKQTSISKPMLLLRHASLMEREAPFPDGSAESKRTLYKISDFALRFWYRVYSPHRSRWHRYTPEKQRQLIHDHAAGVLEDVFRSNFQDARKFWQGAEVEIDSVRYVNEDLTSVCVTEIKHTKLTNKDRERLADALKSKFAMTSLANHYKLGCVEILNTTDVLSLLKE